MKIPALVRFIKEQRPESAECTRYCVQSPSFRGDQVWRNVGTLYVYRSSCEWMAEEAFEEALGKLDKGHRDRYESPSAHGDPAVFAKIRILDMSRRLLDEPELRNEVVIPRQFEQVLSSELPNFISKGLAT